ncbi:acyl-CoA thioesterase [Halobacteriales archaeon QS_8_69_26]|nr:MAG: acyl-CoA thioesterase [Halobacteriales archaeon QS_8_69_26]
MPTLLDTYLENRKRIQPNDANNYETAHGGIVMKAMDEVGAMSAMRFAGETCVTAGVDDLSFRQPIPVGEVARIVAFVYDAGRTSVRVRIRADREDPRTGEQERTTESCFTFVAVDDEGDPTRVPELRVESDRGRRLRDEALEAEESAKGGN